MGAQGSGKGTQAARLAPRLRLEHLSTGDLFREAIAAKSPLGQRVQPIYDRGDLIPDDLTVALVEERLDRIAADRAEGLAARGALFDGFPRTLAQAEALDALLARRGEAIAAIVEIDVPMDQLVSRLSGRRVCPNCGTTYHVEFNPPKQAGVCDVCGGTPAQRDDDKPGPITRRLENYRTQTAPLLAYYRERGLLTRVDGAQDIELVTQAILDAVGPRLADGATSGTSDGPVRDEA
ncbi:MAG: Adenylate kinase [uncultured Thermomicrobiales bacterium]|uniref:Adenylate kinase n=1 Tax=uncultured Thermomicrobiales bacterium TaxID=1645740 RepID=A0A6J4V4W4_9BACT|nr:MAG: Adenylate kinase [uncultured Thermomicrobiales bacterium]